MSDLMTQAGLKNASYSSSTEPRHTKTHLRTHVNRCEDVRTCLIFFSL